MAATTDDQPDVVGEVLAAADHLVGRFGSHDTAAYFACFAEDATFVFHNHPARLGSRAEWEALWHQWETEDGFRVAGCRSSDQAVQVVGPDLAVFTHSVETDVVLGGDASRSQERETIVFQRRPGGWIAVHEHLSPAPSAPGAGS